jgi:hypothetical protein
MKRRFRPPGTAPWPGPPPATLYVLDHKGVIRHKWVGSPGGKALDAALEQLIPEADRALTSKKTKHPTPPGN